MNDFVCEFCQKPAISPNYLERLKFEGNDIWLCYDCLIPASVAMGLTSHKLDLEDIVSGGYQRVKKVLAPKLTVKQQKEIIRQLKKMESIKELTPTLREKILTQYDK